MLDPKLLRTDLQAVQERLRSRGLELDWDAFQELEAQRKVLQIETETLQATKNSRAKSIGRAKAAGEDIAILLAEVEGLSEKLKKNTKELHLLQERWQDFCARIPNIPDASVPIGRTEQENVVVRVSGDPPEFTFPVRDHTTVAVSVEQMDLATAAHLSGARFVVLHHDLAQLQRALINFMLDTHVQVHGYQEVAVPFLVKSKTLFGTGQLPKFAEDSFQVANSDLWLIPTGEVPLTNLVAESIVAKNALPKKLVSHTPCFRSESGSYGKDTKGIFRHHQFEKVELVQIVLPEQSHQAHEELTYHAEVILQKLELPYRVVNLCTGDLGFSACKTYDLEVWLPSQHRYREISSCSHFGDFQARRMKARYREDEKRTHYLHTVNGSGLAVGRTLLAILENYQDEDGRVAIPKVLQPYMFGKTML